MSLEKMYNELSDEAKARVKACKTPEELFALAVEEGFDLSDDALEGIVGGSSWLDKCGCEGPAFCSTNTTVHDS